MPAKARPAMAVGSAKREALKISDHRSQLDKSMKITEYLRRAPRRDKLRGSVMHKSAVLGIALSLLGPGVLKSWGQTGASGTINVTVLDPTGASIPGATLEIKDLGTNDLRRAATQQTGAYTFPNLPFGAYQLTITAAGFQPQVFGA